jgi:penicillin G amidase
MAARTRVATGIAAAAAGVAGIIGLRRMLLRLPVPPRNESLALKGLRAPVEILIDQSGVPHLYAANTSDLVFGQGYVHARDRLWQMELNRRIAAGTLAELFGAPALEADRFLRRLGFGRDALRDLAALSDDARALLDAYAAGVNAYVAHHRPPLEFMLLRTGPKPWKATDSLAFGRYMGWTQTPNWETELIRGRLLDRLGPERVTLMEPGNPLTALSGLSGGASNNWVAAGDRSSTGRPLLANDPHLYPRIPAVWYVAHLNGGDLDVAGATLPGVPGVVIGHTARIAWGVTAGMADCEDLFLERPDPDDHHRFAFKDGYEPATVTRETYVIRGRAAPLEEDVIRTRHGPLLNGTLDIPVDGMPLALRSALHDAPNPVEGLFRLNRATDWGTFRAALEGWTFPCLNFVYADVDGNIGYKLAGRVPIRAKGDGYAPVPGWTGEEEWTGYIPFDEMPEAFNPPDGVFATANSRPDAPSGHFLARDWVDDSRWRRIIELLRSRPRHTLEDFQAMQADQVSLPAKAIVEALPSDASGDPLARKALGFLHAWNGRLSADSAAAAIYEVFRVELLRALNRDLDGGQQDILLGKGPDPLIAPVTAFYFRGSSELIGHLQQADAAVVRAALESAIAFLRRELGGDVDSWEWGRLHRITFAHPIGVGVPTLDRVLHLSRGPLPIGGDADTIAQAGVDPWHPFAANAFMVSYRQLFDVGAWDEARFILPTGQSGHPGSRHYDDMIEPWRRVQYRLLPFSRAAVAAAVAETAALLPA